MKRARRSKSTACSSHKKISPDDSGCREKVAVFTECESHPAIGRRKRAEEKVDGAVFGFRYRTPISLPGVVSRDARYSFREKASARLIQKESVTANSRPYLNTTGLGGLTCLHDQAGTSVWPYFRLCHLDSPRSTGLHRRGTPLLGLTPSFSKMIGRCWSVFATPLNCLTSI